jgi:hypothetical protein
MLELETVLNQVNATRTITTALAPAILVSAAGLMLLGLQNKFHNIADRIRQLDHEITQMEGIPELNGTRKKRVASAEVQVDILIVRCRLVRDAIFLIYVAVMLLIASTLIAALGVIIGRDLEALTFVSFVAAVVCLLLSTVQSIREVSRSFTVITEEVEGAREISPLREKPLPKAK